MYRTLIQEKLQQAVGILNELDLDCWLTYARETVEIRDPALHFLAGDHDVVWEAVFVVHRGGRKVVILGGLDAPDYQHLGVYDQVITYMQSIGDSLRQCLTDLSPKSIAINYSSDNVSADGLTLGLYQRLCKHLQGTPYAERLVSAQGLLAKLRGRKTAEELARITTATEETLELFDCLTRDIKPGWTLRKISDYMHSLMEERRLGSSWSWSGDPGITSGPAMEGGHATPDDTLVEAGHILHLDFGIKKAGYSSDLQRCWYALRPDETHAPEDILRAFAVVQLGIREAAKALKPGVSGWEIDTVARRVLAENGYPEYPHALGHQVGIWAHDGGSVLGPRWERYGQRPYTPVEAGEVYTLEFGVQTSGGYLAQEEMVVVTQDGCRFVVQPQKELWLLRGF